MIADFDPETLFADAPELAAHREASTISGIEDYLDFYRLNFIGDYPAVKHYFGKFDVAEETIVAHVWALPGAELTAYICHGYYDHAGLFRHVIDYCLSRHISVVIWDFPGHGLSTGFRASIDDFDNYLDVLDEVLVRTLAFPLPKRRIIMGQSMGGAITMSYLLLRNEAAFEKAVLFAPLVRPADHWWGRPAHAILKFFRKRIPRRFAESSGDGKFLRFLRKSDPLQAKYLSLPWVAAWKKWEPKFLKLSESNLTPLIIQGDDDHTVAWQFNLKVISKIFPNASVKVLKGAKHHLVNETRDIREKLWDTVDDYILSDKKAESTEELSGTPDA